MYFPNFILPRFLNLPVSNAVSELSLIVYLEQGYGFALTQPLLLYRPAKTKGVPADELSYSPCCFGLFLLFVLMSYPLALRVPGLDTPSLTMPIKSD